MIEIDDLSLNEWYACLKPYQKVVIEQLPPSCTIFRTFWNESFQ